MQNKSLKFKSVLIPTEMLDEAGITENAIVEMMVIDGNIIIRGTKDTDDYVCDDDCENCPFTYMECDDNCEDCPCKNICEDYIESEEK